MVTEAFISTSCEKKAGLNRSDGSADAPKHEKELHRSSDELTHSLSSLKQTGPTYYGNDRAKGTHHDLLAVSRVFEPDHTGDREGEECEGWISTSSEDGNNGHQSRVKYKDGGVRMKGIPQGRYTKEFREEAVKLVTEGNMTIPAAAPRVSLPPST